MRHVLRERVRTIHDGGRPPGAPRWALVVFGAAMLVAFVVILILNRGMTQTPDELSFFLTTPTLSPREAVEPYGGQLLLTTRVVYRVLLEVFGSGYLPFRVLAATTVVATVAVFYAYASRAIGRVAALAPSLVLLFFGSDSLHVLAGNAFTVLLPIACGIAALLAIKRGDRLGDAAACALLCLAVLTYGTGLAVTVGVATAIFLRADRWRRAWIVLVPVGMYAAWWLWARTSTDAGSGIVAWNLLVIPAWSFESLGAVVSSVVGLNYKFAGAPGPIQAGPALALVALAALAWRAKTGPLPRTFWPALGAILALWAMQSLAANEAENFPTSSHYMFPATLLVLVVALQAARGLRWPGAVLLVVFAVATISVGTNLSTLRHRASAYRYEYAPQARAALTGLDVAGPSADPTFAFAGLSLHPGLELAFAAGREAPTTAYLAASERYGALGYEPAELSETGKGTQPREAAIADTVLVTALRLAIQPGQREARGSGCRRIGARPATFPLEPGNAVLLRGASGPVTVRRFSATATNQIGVATPDRPFLLRIPRDRAPERPWQVSVAGSSLRVCDAG